MNRSCYIFFALLLVGCATQRSNYVPVSMAISDPPLGSISVVAVGDVMLRQGEYVEHDAIYVPQAIDVGLFVIQPGYYLKTGDGPGTEFFYPGGSEPGNIDKSALVDGWSGLLVRGRSEQICVLTSYNTAITTCSSNGSFQRKKVSEIHKRKIQQTLIYSGKVGDKVNISYREFSGNFARPEFGNNVEYDLTESNVIGYKGARLEVIEATNQSIKFKVLKNFNSAMM